MRILPLFFLPCLSLTIVWSGQETFQPASSVLGQANFAEDTNYSPPTQKSFDSPEDIAVDPSTGKVFVADYGNNRVLRFSSSAAYQNNSDAEAVFGQGGFTTDGSGVTASNMDRPSGLAFDSAGNLYVAEYGNHRILRFDDASNKPSLDPADEVIGQPDFMTNASGTSQNSFNGPGDVEIDSAGRLWVADYSNNRVLRFDNAGSLSKQENAVVVLGQENFDTDNSGDQSDELYLPWGLDIDSSGNLWVGDAGNNRVLKFTNAVGKLSGDPADVVLGQSDFGESADPVEASADAFGAAWYVVVDSEGTLWVSDYDFSRVMGFKNAAAKGNGAAAQVVLGQPNMTTVLMDTPNQRNIPGAYGLEIGKGGSLLVGAYDIDRIMVFEEPVVNPSTSVLKTVFQNKIKKLKKKLKKLKKKGKKAKAKKIKKKIKKFKKKLAAL